MGGGGGFRKAGRDVSGYFIGCMRGIYGWGV